jgi:hypothetical protein
MSKFEKELNKLLLLALIQKDIDRLRKIILADIKKFGDVKWIY